MEHDEIDTDEEVEKLNKNVYETQKIIQESGIVDETAIYERLHKNSDSEPGDISGDIDPALRGSKIRTCLMVLVTVFLFLILLFCFRLSRVSSS